MIQKEMLITLNTTGFYEDDPWPLLDENQTGKHNTPAPDNQSMSLPLPDDLGNS